jgi:hypothetical protein
MNDRLPGSSWSNPIWYRKHWRIYMNWYSVIGDEWTYSHDDWDGAEDSGDDRIGHASTVEACKAEIDERYPTK